jgi:hypothetical protein
LDVLRIDGRPCKLIRNPEAYAAAEAREGMLAWNGDAENMIDRFDGRALLDFYKDPDPRNKPQKTDDELELEEVPPPSFAFTTLKITFEEVYTLTSRKFVLRSAAHECCDASHNF